jgi:fructose 1,6-bisphosphatase
MTPAQKAYAQASEELRDMEEIAMTDDLVERANAAYWKRDRIDHPTHQERLADAIAIALEKAAQVAEERVAYSTGQAVIRDSIAAAIRAMIPSGTALAQDDTGSAE